MTTIAVFASGTRGDVQPYVALGQALAAQGHAVRLITSDDFADLARDAGLDFRSTGIGVEHMLQSPEWKRTVEGGNMITMIRHMNREMNVRADALARETPALFAGSDLVLAGLAGAMSGFSIAEALDLPIVQAYVMPITPTAYMASPIAPDLPLGALNRASYMPLRQMLWMSGRAGDVAVRRALGLPAGGRMGPFGALDRSGAGVLYGFSRHVLPPPPDWGSRCHVTGYWFLDPPGEWAPPADLAAFLAAGPPPVYIGFGSMGNRDPQATTAIALKALALSGQRGVLASGWGGLSADALPENVFMLKAAPHAWLFPRMAAVVHHGGAGTTAAGLRAGVPAIIVPFFGDQSFWGRRVAGLGVGPAPIARRRLTAERLANAIRQAVSDEAMRQRARDLSLRIGDERGAERSAALAPGLAARVRLAR